MQTLSSAWVILSPLKTRLSFSFSFLFFFFVKITRTHILRVGRGGERKGAKWSATQSGRLHLLFPSEVATWVSKKSNVWKKNGKKKKKGGKEWTTYVSTLWGFFFLQFLIGNSSQLLSLSLSLFFFFFPLQGGKQIKVSSIWERERFPCSDGKFPQLFTIRENRGGQVGFGFFFFLECWHKASGLSL